MSSSHSIVPPQAPAALPGNTVRQLVQSGAAAREAGPSGFRPGCRARPLQSLAVDWGVHARTPSFSSKTKVAASVMFKTFRNTSLVRRFFTATRCRIGSDDVLQPRAIDDLQMPPVIEPDKLAALQDPERAAYRR